ncbi:unnamed protein product, partial [Hydatigera taeniaeformis]|uniref:V-SNARE coiled-coil homology domain-containing protein n=1 Tax=Hydatigena taeniaeformis TaxID=6205 RepID=A0A0R3XD69_HYDTA
IKNKFPPLLEPGFANKARLCGNVRNLDQTGDQRQPQQPPTADKKPEKTINKRLQRTQAQVNEVVDIMRVNIEKVLERDKNLSQLDDRAGETFNASFITIFWSCLCKSMKNSSPTGSLSKTRCRIFFFQIS